VGDESVGAGSAACQHGKRRYGLTAGDVLAMLRAQLWRCPICLTALTLKTAHVDHDHQTGRLRAVVCLNCNGGLGQFQDNPVSMRRAAAYVEGDAWQPTQLARGVFQVPFSRPAAPPSPTSSAITRLSSFLAGARRPQPR
jgi:recombination endonuclease VII